MSPMPKDCKVGLFRAQVHGRRKVSVMGGGSALGLIRVREVAYCLEKTGKDTDLQAVERIVPLLMH